MASSSSHQRTEVCRRVKLPRLKLEDLVAQVTEENTHREILTSPQLEMKSGRCSMPYTGMPLNQYLQIITVSAAIREQ